MDVYLFLIFEKFMPAGERTKQIFESDSVYGMGEWLGGTRFSIEYSSQVGEKGK